MLSQHMTDSNTARKRQGVVPDSFTRRDTRTKLEERCLKVPERSPKGDVLVLREKCIYELKFLASYWVQCQNCFWETDSRLFWFLNASYMHNNVIQTNQTESILTGRNMFVLFSFYRHGQCVRVCVRPQKYHLTKFELGKSFKEEW